MSGSRREFHVAQQTRREKLRIQQNSFAEQLGFHNNNLDLVQVRNVRNGGDNIVDDAAAAAAAAAFYSSEMIPNNTPLVEPGPHLYSSLFPHSSPKEEEWRNSHQVSDWMVNNFLASSHDEFNNNVSATPVYHNVLQDIFKSPHGTWGGHNSNNGNEHVQYGNLVNPSPHQGLCLSLSSNSQSKPCIQQDDPQIQYSNSPNSTSGGYRNIGPLGPFTGYATILKSSRFLKPCQQLLDEHCCQKPKSDDKKSPQWVSRENHSASSVSSSSSRPECQKNKAKLLYMQEEVTRRYKQYHQQMQMVVASFDSVAGLTSATPYISSALKSVSRHFRCLKNAISDQLKLTCEVLGEDFSLPTTSTSGKIVDNNNMAIRLRCNMDQSFQKNKSNNMDFLEPQQQHVWRAPQRGLPERAVAILKAWLFEHFLHPYPTDTDKHMLATQTGLSRNQVSNWFINARVRVWKPMVEEIHMLETQGSATETRQNSSKMDQGPNSATEGVFVSSTHDAMSPDKQFQCLEMGSCSSAVEKGIITDHDDEEQYWNQEKRSKYECDHIAQASPRMDGSTVMGFMPYRRGGGLEFGPGLGSVSLTLGLRHGVEGAQQQFQHEEELRGQYGGHMIHDFVG